jgi:hypothetical protein
MLITLDDKTELIDAKIDAKIIQEMVQAYRHHPETKKDALKFSNFAVKEILELFKDNGIIDSYQTSADVKKFGLRIYMGNHFDGITCPNNPEYKGCDTTILCNTIVVDAAKGEFYDMLKYGKKIAFPMERDPEGYGLDQTYICPPTCPPSCVRIPNDPNDPDYTGFCLNDIGA